MKRKIYYKKIISLLISALMLASMPVNMACGAITYYILTYKVGEADNVVGASEIHFDKIANATFDVADASRFSRKGYTIESWYIPSTEETVATGSQYRMPESDITFIANWKPAVYPVSFAGKGGKTEQGSANLSSQATFGEPFVLPECEFIYSGCEFAGWKYDNVVYEAGQQFTVPALLTGSKIVFAAVWKAEGSSPAETAPDVTEPDDTETDIQDENTVVYPVKFALDCNNDENKVCQIPLGEALSAGTIEELKINLSADSGNIGEVILGIGANVNGEWFSLDFHETIEKKTCSIDFANSEICGSIDGEYLQVGYWWGTAEPLNIDSITVKYASGSVNDEHESTEPTETTEEYTEAEETETTPETETETETTVITDETDEPEETEDPDETETTASQEEPEIVTTTAAVLPDSQYSKVVELNETIVKNSMLSLPNDKITQTNQIVESIEFRFRADDNIFDNYSLAVSVANKYSAYDQYEYNDFCSGDELVITALIPEYSQAYVISDNFISIGYWWGNAESITLESVKVNYRIKVGDYNQDGLVGEDDIDALRKYMVGVSVDGYDLDAESADANDDGIVDVFDCMMLSRLMN